MTRVAVGGAAPRIRRFAGYPHGVSTQPHAGPTRVGDYTLITRLGEGGMGIVHLARGVDGRRVALKVLRDHVVGDREARARLAREVGSLSRVRSPWVAEILAADPWAEVPYVVTRYVPGLSLHDHVAEEGPVEDRDLLWLAGCLAEGIEAVHSAGVLHRDVKPSNVLMEGRTPILIDFGLARVAEDPRLTQTGWLLGTPGYLAPEILYGDEATPAADVHAWAATVAYAATGRSPYGRGPAMAIMDRARRGEHDLTGIDRPLADVLDAALSPEPLERPLLEELLAWLRPLSTRPTEPEVGPPVGGVLGGPAAPDADDFTLPLALAAQAGVVVPPVEAPAGAPGASVPVRPPGLAPPHAAETTPLTAGGTPEAAAAAPAVTVVGPADATPTLREPTPATPPPLPTRRMPDAGAASYPPPAPRAQPAPTPPTPAGPVGPLVGAGAPSDPGHTPGQPGAPDALTRMEHEWDQQYGLLEPPPTVGAAERVRRGVAVVAGSFVLGGAFAVAPWVTLIGIVVAVWLLRAGSLATSAVADRRSLRGRKWYDALGLAFSSPWHLLRAVTGTLVLTLWSAGLGLAAGLLCYAFALELPTTFLISGATLGVALWSGPGSTRFRSPIGRVLYPLTRAPGSWVLLCAALLIAGALLAMVAVGQGASWAPADGAPFGIG